MVIWHKIAGLLIVGYLCMTRSFAYLGVPPLFIGEIVLGGFLLLKPRVALGTWAASLLRMSPLNALGLALLIFVLYGIWQVARGVISGSSLFYTLKFFIFNYYVVYLLLGIWIGLRSPLFLYNLIKILAWTHAIYGLLWLLVLRSLAVQIPGSDIALFGLPAGGAVAILGLLCLERNLRAHWLVLALNILVTLAMQARATWLGLALGVLVWGLLTGRFGRVILVGMAGLLVLGLIELGGVQIRLSSSSGSGATLSRDVLGIVIAPIDPKLAYKISPRAAIKTETAEWRQKWWDQIWLSVHSKPLLEAFGHGYGFDLWGLAPEKVRAGQAEDIRTPHNIFYFALGYTGWVGVALFGFLQLATVRLLWRSFRLTRQPVGLVWWAMGMSMAFVEVSFDTPYKAIPFYLLMGLSIAPGLQSQEERDAYPARAQLLPNAGR